VLLDEQRRCRDVYLLHDLGAVAVASEGAAAIGAGLQRVFLEVADLFGGNSGRSCLGCPGWPPMVRGLPSGSGGSLGLTMSEDGGLDEVEESLRAAASCSRRVAASAREASSCRCKPSPCARSR